ncbi:electron transport complex subunit RsxC [Halarsenatibacter silvermanii]|uniref:Ion-translocating oxidoreductase complex subunit C n=1 Tax=Halarsenatibacter silvermanii TaxID=321763 RepID=A0A1G9PB95_9FIRM|nr:electron transport complex subunit RsxC [Halarsenatibacter silvermanii]SDL95497.1 electron transport complex protein RnfC [Halarsenatibacter silvermanii]
MLGLFKNKTKGVHPPENKHLSADSQLEKPSPPEEVAVPIQQHIGAPLELMIEKGDEVKKGQKLADSEAFVSAPVHATISGEVKSIEKVATPSGEKVTAVRITASDSDQQEGFSKIEVDDFDSENPSPSAIRNCVREAGIAGMGGAMFPTHVKLSVPEDKEIDHFILNGAECEPYLTVDHRMMVEKSKKILRGFELLMKAVEVEKGIIAIEENKPDAIKTMRNLVSDKKEIKVEVLPSKYPQGGETVLIKTLLNREVPVDGLPLDVGVIVNNVATASAVADAVDRRKPMIERPLTVTGKGVNNPGNYIVPIGTPINEIISLAGVYAEGPGKVIAGGPMLGKSIAEIQAPVVKGTSGVLVLRKEEVEKYDPDPCIKCARCVDACPCDLMPLNLSKYARKEKVEKLDEYKVSNCIECGSCSYICPAQRPLVHYIRLGKAQLNEQQQSE